LGGQCLGQAGEGDVAVPAGPGPSFEVVQTEAVLGLGVVVLDPPAHFREADELAQADVGGQGRQPVVGGFGLAGRPLGE
jgi:hypothetical protein